MDLTEIGSSFGVLFALAAISIIARIASKGIVDKESYEIMPGTIIFDLIGICISIASGTSYVNEINYYEGPRASFGFIGIIISIIIVILLEKVMKIGQLWDKSMGAAVIISIIGLADCFLIGILAAQLVALIAALIFFALLALTEED